MNDIPRRLVAVGASLKRVPFWCRWGFHKLVRVTIKWHDGGPYLGWHACRRCGEIDDIADQVKDWPPFTMVFK